jgi:uncharacterized membrane protein YcfT
MSVQRADERMVWMDTLRGAAILLVVFDHALAALDQFGGGRPPFVTSVSEAFTPFRIPTLMFLSGLLVDRSLKKGVPQFVSGKLRAIAWPFLVWSVVLLAVQDELTWADLGYSLWSAPNVLWYLWFLVVFYLSMVVVRTLPPLPVAVVALVLSTVAPGFLRLDRMMFLFAFFVIGYWADQHRGRWLPVVRQPTFLGCAAVTGVGLAALSIDGVQVRYEFAYALWTLLAVGGLIGAATYLSTTAVLSRALSFVGRRSSVYYVTHWPVLQLTIGGLVALGVTNVVHQMSLAVLAVAGVGTALAHASRRSRAVDLLFQLPQRRPRPAGAPPRHGSAAGARSRRSRAAGRQAR